MADETWPSTLPQYVDRGGFSYVLSASSTSTSMSTGYDKRRKKFTGQYATYNVSMSVTLEQLSIFEIFFNNNLGYGVVYFNFPDPLFIEDTIEVRINAGSSTAPYSITPYGETDDTVTLSFTMSRLITSYTTVSVSEWPSILPQVSLHDSYSSTVQSGVIMDSSSEEGLVNSRRRFTAVIREHTLAYVMTREQLEYFFNFYASLGHGSLSFTAPSPYDASTTMKARIKTSDGIGFDVGYYDDTDLFIVDLILEELPFLGDWS